MVLRAGQGTVLASPAFERAAHPTADAEGWRTPAPRSGDPRVMALAGALCRTLPAAVGFTSMNLRVLIAGLPGSRIAVYSTKACNRLLVPLTVADQPRAALTAITRHVDDYANRARLPRAA